MRQISSIVCPACNKHNLILKYEVTYEYSYALDADAPGQCNEIEFLPYLYDNREQKEARQYIQCESCGAAYPCYIEEWNRGVNADSLQKAINSAYGADVEK